MKRARSLPRCCVAAVALSPLLVFAADAVPTEKDSVAASRAVKLSEKLRCLVCQNQTIADSNAELAQDLRRQVREQIAAGKSDDEIVAYMVARYGDFVLYQPPVKATTVLLWAGPALLLLLGVFGLVRMLRARRGRGRSAAAHRRGARARRAAAGRRQRERPLVITFVLIAAAMVAAALAWVLVPLLQRGKPGGVAREASNVAILRDQLRELDADLATGTMPRDQYEQAKRELEQRVLEESQAIPQRAQRPDAVGGVDGGDPRRRDPDRGAAAVRRAGQPRRVRADGRAQRARAAPSTR